MTESSNKRRRIGGLPLAIVVASSVGVLAGWQLRAPGPTAGAAESVEETARAQVERFYAATSGREALADVLGDAFQIIRTDGTRYDRAGYLGNPASLQSYSLDGFKATRAGDTLIVTFYASVRGTIEGVSRDSGRLPRLAVFIKEKDEWKLQAFATLGLGLVGNPEAMGREAVNAWLDAVAAGDPDRIRAILAPEFQIVRADGSAYTAQEYLEHGLPKIADKPAVTNLVVTGFGDHLVARYWLTVNETIGGKTVQAHAPRLTVFRRSEGAWLVLAHANLANIAD